MNTQRSIWGEIISQDLCVQKLLENAALIGGIYTMGFEDCFVLTNDLWKHNAGGVPQHCFLIATAMQPGQAPETAEDEEVILLRVVGPAPLPAEAELISVRAEAMREIVTSDGMEASSTPSAILDVLTRNEIQFSAVKAKILGTFYETEVNGGPLLTFGSDIETFYSASRYKVYKPYGQSLSIIASYPKITIQEAQKYVDSGIKSARINIGNIRYTSSIRRRQKSKGSTKNTVVPVSVNIEDFIAMKTAVFGMTRLGKSNMMKILATAIFQHSQETGQNIGQLLFDPAGEYANVNVQDQTALAQIGVDHVTIFRFGASGQEAGVRPLSTNFFSDQTVDVTWSIISAYLSQGSHAESGYVKSFLAANVIGPERKEDDRSAWYRAERRRAVLYATLLKANFAPPKNLSVTFAANTDVVQAVNTVLHKNGHNPIESRSGNLTLNTDNLQKWVEALFDAAKEGRIPDGWIDSDMDALLTMFRGSAGLGYRLLEQIRIFHSPTETRNDYAEDVLTELIAGKIVIVDLSLGNEVVLKFISERIINHIVTNAARRFADGKKPHDLQIYLEEAHRLFNRDRFKAPNEADPYVRLAKEAAKFKIGLVYATQEVTSVDPIILANTSNWIITHLNNKIEIQELSKYYDFEDFAELTLKAEDVGFVRLKTRSGRYIIPAQIDLFSPERVQAARASAQTVSKARG